MSTSVRERTTDDFVLLAGTLSPSKAREQLAPASYGVVLDEQSTPVALVVAEDLEQAASRGAPSLLDSETGLPPAVVVGSEVQMRELVESGAIAVFDIGARGAIVLDDEGVVGILPVEAVDEYLGSGEYDLPVKTMGPSAKVAETGLGGSHQTPLGKVTCAGCGFVNTLAFLDEEHLPACQNPKKPTHTLRLPREGG